jgi:type IV pilus assembly protein PilB
MSEDACEYESQFPFVDLSTLELDREMGLMIPREISARIDGVCVGKPSDDQLSLVVSDPTEITIYNIIEVSSKGEYRAVLLRGDPALIRLAREYVYEVSSVRQHEPWQEWLQSKKFDSEDIALKEKGDKEPGSEITGTAVESADRLIKEAIAVGASDIHLEMFEDVLLVRYRQDGVLRVVDEITPLSEAKALIKRIKIMARVDVTQDRINQGGRISVEVGAKSYDLRVSIVPVAEGQSIVLRLLNKGEFNTSLTDLGFSPKHFQLYQQLIQRPHGMILTCGPTGSGKSTTLSASLKEIARPDRKVVTVEDPIEFRLPGVVQVQVNTAPKEASKRVTFANTLREFLRQDPDVILVGEIRDDETANVSVQAALTGHLLLSTLHTNDAVGAVNRLKELKVEPYLLASTLLGVVAQRLTRRNCPHCSEPVDPSPFELTLFQKHGFSEDQIKLKKGKGCTKCRRTGHLGRVGVFEILNATEEIRDLIERSATKLQISTLAKEQGMSTLLDDALSKAANGEISIEEVKRVCEVDLLEF